MTEVLDSVKSVFVLFATSVAVLAPNEWKTTKE